MVCLAGAPKFIMDKLQQVLNAATCRHTGKYDRSLTILVLDELHWLDVLDRVTYKLQNWHINALMSEWPGFAISRQLLSLTLLVVLALDLEGVHDVKLHHPSSSVATSNQ